MTSIGIIANPASGKDIRRLVSYATVIDNNEKVNIAKRIVLAAQGLGVDRVYFMPDTFRVGYAVDETLRRERVLTTAVEVLDVELTASADDSTRAAAAMEQLGVGAIVVLGGDGTCRAVAKAVVDTPIVPISTGTNNVYPAMLEGTVAGMAAAAAARLGGHNSCLRDKRINVYVNGEWRDLALIDAVVSDQIYIGSRAIWNASDIRLIVVTRGHPASIGFSAIAGCLEVVRDDDDRGYIVTLGEPGRAIRAPIAAGVLEDLVVASAGPLALGQSFELVAERSGTIALDGEREINVRAGDALKFVVERDGPWRVKTRDILEQAKAMGFFEKE